jgi:acyl-phosphate glycerol 3-phosphate acyltransferase
MDSVLLWTLIAFLSGSLPFAYWLGRLFARKDIRTVGDGNPGGFNAWKAGGFAVGFTAGLLDMFKGLVPVSLAVASGVEGWGIVTVAVAPVMGHAFTPFLGFRGGKAIAATLGVWMGLIGISSWVAFALPSLAILALQDENALAAIAGMLGLPLFLWLSGNPAYFMAVWAGHFLILTYKHRKELRQPLRVRPWASGLFARRAP